MITKEYEYVILGGGVAGLCAARRLLELDLQPLVIEAGSYPCHKVCGEFISPSGVELLKKWKIDSIPIYHIHLHTASDTLNFTFPNSAGSLSHYTLDTQLADQIIQQGGSLFTNTKVLHLSPALKDGEFHTLQLSSGDIILAKQLLIAAGRLPGFYQNSKPLYKGFKSHFTGVDLHSTLEMFSFPNAYLGIVPIENGRCNLACLAKIKKSQQLIHPKVFIQDLVEKHSRLKQLLASSQNVFSDWMEAYVPEFGLRSPPEWPRTYWIGDASGTIPPASGNGLSLALASGYLAAEFALKNDAKGFKRAWKQRCASQILYGKGLHYLFLHPFLGSQAIKLSREFPFLAQKFFSLTRDSAI